MHALSSDDGELRSRVRAAVLGGESQLATLAALEESCDPHELLRATIDAIAEPVWGLADLRASGVGLATGSGGVPLRTVNVSTAAAVVASRVDGVGVVKCGARRSRSKGVGPAGVLSLLGLASCTSLAELERSVGRFGFAVIDATTAFPWLDCDELCTFGFLVEARRRARFDPIAATWKLNGLVDRAALQDSVSWALRSATPTTIVTGETDVVGLRFDDPSTAGTTTIVNVDRERTISTTVEPESLGLTRVGVHEWCVPPQVDAAAALWAVLHGDAPRAWIELVAFAAAVLVTAAIPACPLPDAVREMKALLHAGAAAQTLVEMIREDRG